MKFIETLKIGDKVITLERNGSSVWKWESTIIAIESNYIETEYRRLEKEIPIEYMNKLVPNHRATFKQTVKNYFDPNGLINIEQ